jgi:hypothetical protein
MPSAESSRATCERLLPLTTPLTASPWSEWTNQRPLSAVPLDEEGRNPSRQESLELACPASSLECDSSISDEALIPPPGPLALAFLSGMDTQDIPIIVR